MGLFVLDGYRKGGLEGFKGSVTKQRVRNQTRRKGLGAYTDMTP